MGFIGTVISLVWIREHWKLLLGIIIGIILLHSAIKTAKHSRAIADQQRAAQQREESRKLAEEAARRRAEMDIDRAREEIRRAESNAPYQPPATWGPYVLAYSYPDVDIFCPDEMKASAQAVEPNQQLRLVEETDNPYDAKAVKIFSGDTPIGYMYKNRLRDMVYDFAADKERDFLAVSTKWTDKPQIGLYFYRLDDSDYDDLDDSDDDDDFYD